ncbi:MAG: ABC transporter ATP-binding protein [Nitrospirae bacterium]|nr:ABC transporter ATP-binding protein [Nitrospirota bacterium]
MSLRHDPHAIRIRNVTKILKGKTVLSDVTLDIPGGKTTVVIGQSGVGKSVLVKHIVGLMKPDRGSVFVGDVEVNSLDDRALNRLRKKFGMLFQGGALFGSMSVGENVAFPLVKHTQLKDTEIRDIVAEKLRLVGMPGTEHYNPSELSGGMRKRVALARAIVMDPEVVVFDEPTSGLDPVTSDAIDRLILDTQARLGITYIVISHDIKSTFKIAHTIGMLYQSKLVAYGPKDEIRKASTRFQDEGSTRRPPSEAERANDILSQFFEGRSDGPIKVL